MHNVIFFMHIEKCLVQDGNTFLYIQHITHCLHKKEFLLKFAKDRRCWIPLNYLTENAIKQEADIHGKNGKI
jgi:hypothetical protein